jgi:hypothetical protein
VWRKVDPAAYYPTAPAQIASQNVAGKQLSSSKLQTVPFLANLENAEEKVLSQITGLFGRTQNMQPAPTVPSFIQNQYAPPSRPQVVVPRQVVQEIVKPQTPQVLIPKQVVQEIPRVQAPTPLASGGARTTPVSTVISQVLTPQKIGVNGGVAASFSMGAAPPIPPESPNLIVGQVLDGAGKIVEGAILEIKDAQGRPVRALKSARTGHFRIVTPLEDGDYKILIEKEGLVFAPVNFTTKGEIIEPIMITAKPKA